MRHLILSAALLMTASPALAQTGTGTGTGTSQDCRTARLVNAVFTSRAIAGGRYTYDVQITNTTNSRLNYVLSFSASGLPDAVRDKPGRLGAGAAIRHALASGDQRLTAQVMGQLTSLRCTPA